MNITTYLTNRLKKSSEYTLTENDKKIIKKEGVSFYILKKLLSKKFREWKALPECIKRTKRAINSSVKQNAPITVVFPQGGYKLWKLPSTPEVDWAEFFNISYLIRYLAPIVQTYKPGVTLRYYMHTLLMEAHDNLTTKEIQTYISSFQSLINTFSKYLPSNFQVNIWKDADIYSRKEYFQTLNKFLPQAQNIFESWPQQQKNTYIKMARLNIKWKGKKDLNNLSKKEKENVIKKSLLYEISALHALTRVNKYVKSPNNVLIFTKPTPQFIGVGSCKTSVAKYWVGFGVLEQKGEGFFGRILTPSQLDKAKKLSFEKQKVKLIPLKNFKEVWVFKKPFKFR